MIYCGTVQLSKSQYLHADVHADRVRSLRGSMASMRATPAVRLTAQPGRLPCTGRINFAVPVLKGLAPSLTTYILLRRGASVLLPAKPESRPSCSFGRRYN